MVYWNGKYREILDFFLLQNSYRGTMKISVKDVILVYDPYLIDGLLKYHTISIKLKK